MTKSLQQALRVSRETLETLENIRSDPAQSLDWSLVFTLPAWLRAWRQEIGRDGEACLLAVRQGGRVLGVAPLLVKGAAASLMGSPDVCDYLDFVVSPGAERRFFETLLEYLASQGVEQLDLTGLRPDSKAFAALPAIARSQGCLAVCDREESSVEMTLPATWQEYLAGLDAKQAHEVRRKLRKLETSGIAAYRVITASREIAGGIELFLKMFAESRQDKADFLTPPRLAFFRAMARSLSEIGVFRLGVLELDGTPIAAVACFDYHDRLYLYNSGYDPRFSYLSAGLLCKVYSIREAIERQKRVYDFLKGNETYKFHLGGKEVPLYRCRITLKRSTG